MAFGADPYGYPCWGYRWLPWLPRWWWPVTPWAPYGAPPIPKEQEIAILETQKKLMEQTLDQINKRLEELKKTGE